MWLLPKKARFTQTATKKKMYVHTHNIIMHNNPCAGIMISMDMPSWDDAWHDAWWLHDDDAEEAQWLHKNSQPARHISMDLQKRHDDVTVTHSKQERKAPTTTAPSSHFSPFWLVTLFFVLHHPPLASLQFSSFFCLFVLCLFIIQLQHLISLLSSCSNS